jgi:hypothetical protein
MKSLVKVPLKYGVIAGVVGAVLVVVLYYINRHPFLIDIYMDFRVILFGVFIFFALKELRDYYQDGILYFWQALIGSFIFVGTFAIISSVAIGVFIAAVPEFVQSYIRLMTDRLKALPPETINQIGKEVYDRNLADLPSTNVFDLASLYFWQSFMIGLFISIILSVILRRQPKN